MDSCCARFAGAGGCPRNVQARSFKTPKAPPVVEHGMAKDDEPTVDREFESLQYVPKGGWNRTRGSIIGARVATAVWTLQNVLRNVYDYGVHLHHFSQPAVSRDSGAKHGKSHPEDIFWVMGDSPSQLSAWLAQGVIDFSVLSATRPPWPSGRTDRCILYALPRGAMPSPSGTRYNYIQDWSHWSCGSLFDDY